MSEENRTIEIVDRIQEIRKKNNVAWMNILKIALKSSPDETKAVFAEIVENDRQINELSKELAE